MVQSISEYWNSLTPTRQGLLVVGMIAMLPIIIIVAIVFGCAEAFKFITQISF